MVSLRRQCLQVLPVCLILFVGIVKGEVFQSSSRSIARTFTFPLHYHLVIRGGAQSYDDDDGYDSDSDPSPPSHGNHRPRRPQRRPPSATPSPTPSPSPTPPQKSKSMFSSLAEKSYALTTHAVTATAKQSGKAAYYLIRPKKVELKELTGLWRMDQSMLYDDNNMEEQETSSVTMEVTPAGTILVPRRNDNRDDGDGDDDTKSRYTFTPAHLTASAKLEWRREGYFYRAYVHRKVADPSVIKLKGKIYRIDQTGWRGKNEKLVAVGTFVARRRLRLLPDDEEEDDDDDEESMHEEEDWGDMLAGEEYDDENEEY